MTNLDQILLERSCRYGSFQDVANRTNNIFASILNGAPQLPSTTPLYREALHMIAYKLARLVNGRINDPDSWHDIAGYALLVYNQIMQEEDGKTAKAAKEAKVSQSALSDKAGTPSQFTKSAANPFVDKAVMQAMKAQIAKDLSEEG